MSRAWRRKLVLLTFMLSACSATDDEPGAHAGSGSSGSGTMAAGKGGAGQAGSTQTRDAGLGGASGSGGHSAAGSAGSDEHDAGSNGGSGSGGSGLAGQGGQGGQGGSAQFPTCRTQSDCPMGTGCQIESDTPAIPCRGIACMYYNIAQCSADSDCASTDAGVCHTHFDMLCGDEYRSCGPVCAGNEDCDGAMCQPDGHCRAPTHCTLGTACATHLQCMDAQGSTLNGCVRDACTSDADCGDGFCLGAKCYAALGFCVPPPQPCLAP